MGHRGGPSNAEQMRVMRLLADVAAEVANPVAQRRRLIDGLDRLFGTTMGWFVALDDCRPGRAVRPVVATLTTGMDPYWERYCADFAVHVDPADDPYADHSIRSDAAEQQWELSRVLPDLAAHRRYASAVAMKTDARLGEGAVCAFRTGPDGDQLVALALHRCQGDRPFRPRDYALHRFALTEVRRLHDRGHLPLNAPARPERTISGLPPRQREVLDGMLSGRAPKRIAHELGLSVWTVRDHVKRLYAHFDVCGRDELMARFVDRSATPPSSRT